jgi:hypothetical protein
MRVSDRKRARRWGINGSGSNSSACYQCTAFGNTACHFAKRTANAFGFFIDAV